jgi:hypothetical protein
MSSSRTAVERLDRLRASYRAAFREWISARSVLDAGPRGREAVSKAQAQEGAAALAYRNARNQLTDAMPGWGDRGRIDAEKASRPVPIQMGPSHVTDNEGHEWLRDFILALILVALTVAGSTLFVLTDFSPR